MRKIPLFIVTFGILLVLLVIPQRTKAQKTNWVTLESDTSSISAVGQLIMVTLKASLNTPLTSAGLVLRYDPACLRVTSHQVGTLLTGATSTVIAQPGLFDLTYQLTDKHQGNIGEGSLMRIQLEALKVCASDLSTSSNSVLLKFLDAKGNEVTLPGVEYHTLSLHLNKSPSLAGTATRVVMPALALALPAYVDSTYIFLLSLILLPLLGLLISGLLFYRRAGKLTKQSPAPSELEADKVAALIHSGQSIPLTQPRTRLGLHAEIIQRGTSFYLADTGNQQRTLLNGNHIGRGYYFLHDGDRVQLENEGAYRFVNPRKQRPA